MVEVAAGDGLLREAEGVPSDIRVQFIERLAVHFHDTFGQALPNVLAAVGRGVATVEVAVAGIGRCPFSDKESVNTASEDAAHMLSGRGIETGFDLDGLISAARFICRALERQPASRISRFLEREKRR